MLQINSLSGVKVQNDKLGQVKLLDIIDQVIYLKRSESGDSLERGLLLDFLKLTHKLRAENDLDFFSRSSIKNVKRDPKFESLDLSDFARECDIRIAKEFSNYKSSLFQTKYEEALNSPANSFAELKNALEDSSRRQVLIFDVDNTLRNDVIVDYKNLYPDISKPLLDKLTELDSRENIDVVLLTGRDKEEISRSNLFMSPLRTWGSYGRQRIFKDLVDKSYEEINRDDLNIEALLLDRAKESDLNKSDFRIVTNPNKVYVFIEAEDPNPVRRKLVKAFREYKIPGWHIVDNKNRYFTIKKDGVDHSDKGTAIEAIFKDLGIDEFNMNDLNIYMFGDSNPDLQAMKKINSLLENSRAGIYNTAVGWCIPDQSDWKLNRLASYESVEKLLFSL